MKHFGSIIMQGDYGSPTGQAKIMVPNMPEAPYADNQTKLSTFAAALKAGGFTDCSVGDVTTSQKSESTGTRPGTSVNVREKVFYGWRTTLDSTPRRGSIPGVPKDSTIWQEGSQGDELTAAAKTALETALNALYGLSGGDVAIVLWGKNREK